MFVSPNVAPRTWAQFCSPRVTSPSGRPPVPSVHVGRGRGRGAYALLLSPWAPACPCGDTWGPCVCPVTSPRGVWLCCFRSWGQAGVVAPQPRATSVHYLLSQVLTVPGPGFQLSSPPAWLFGGAVGPPVLLGRVAAWCLSLSARDRCSCPGGQEVLQEVALSGSSTCAQPRRGPVGAEGPASRLSLRV